MPPFLPTSSPRVRSVLTQDYAYINNYREQFSGMASLNLAIFATVMLASRLDTDAKARPRPEATLLLRRHCYV